MEKFRATRPRSEAPPASARPRDPVAEGPQPAACDELSLAFEATIVFDPSTLTWPSRARNVSITAPAVGSRTIVAPLPSNETVSIASVRSTNDAQLISPFEIGRAHV